MPKCAAERVDKTGLAGRRILLAEDNDLNAEIATELMGEEGLLVDRAENGCPLSGNAGEGSGGDV